MGSRNQIQQVPDTCSQTKWQLPTCSTLSADAEWDTISTSLAGPQLQGSSSVSGITTVCCSCLTPCCNELLFTIDHTSQLLTGLVQVLTHSPRASVSCRLPIYATREMRGAHQPHLKETARSLMIMKYQGFLSQI